jgi:hypothetical protein
VVAVRAAVPEQLDHFDLARHGNRNRVAQLDVFLAGNRLGAWTAVIPNTLAATSAALRISLRMLYS